MRLGIAHCFGEDRGSCRVLGEKKVDLLYRERWRTEQWAQSISLANDPRQ